MNRHPLRSTILQSGMTLLACSLVLFGVGLLLSASLRSQQDRISLNYSTIDRSVARQAAESALRDAAMSLSMIPQLGGMVQVQGSHHLGDITGEFFPYGGPVQSCSEPEYFLEVFPLSGSTGKTQQEVSAPYRYRVTATGRGLSQSTMVVLQAEFEAQTCAVVQENGAKDRQSNRQNGTDNNVQDDKQAFEQSSADCIPYVRRIAWRMLRAT